MLVLNILYIYQSHNTACKAGVVHPAGRHAAFGYEDGSIRIYDLQSQQVIHSFTKGLKILLFDYKFKLWCTITISCTLVY